MPTIAFVHQKGGVGKTTTAHNVGVELARRGHDVLFVDADPQGSLSLHVQAMEAPLPIVAADADTLEMVPEHEREGRWILIDCPGQGGDTGVTPAAIAVASFVLLLLRPTQADLDVIGNTVALLHEAREEFGENIPAAVMLAQVIGSSTIDEETRVALDAIGEPILEAYTSTLIEYQRAYGKRQSVIDYKPRGKGAREVRALVDELIALL